MTKTLSNELSADIMRAKNMDEIVLALIRELLRLHDRVSALEDQR